MVVIFHQLSGTTVHSSTFCGTSKFGSSELAHLMAGAQNLKSPVGWTVGGGGGDALRQTLQT